MTLLEDLQSKINDLGTFKSITSRLLKHIPEVTTVKSEYNGYVILSSISGSSEKLTRPYNKTLFIADSEEFETLFGRFLSILGKIKSKKGTFINKDYLTIDRTVYTIQQAIGIGMDLLSTPNSARKHVGNRFEELIKLIVREIGISNKKIVLKIPYGKGMKDVYSCETDLVFSPFPDVKSNSRSIHEKEIVASLKTTSKDRMGKVFIDKLLMGKFVKHKVKVVGIFLNDVQRKGDDKISYTFVSGLFMVYTKFITKLDGIYYIDIPQNAAKAPFTKYISTFSNFLINDAYKLIK